MRFGTFIPQGWRLDLAGIDPADHWPTMLRLAQRAERGPWESIWVYDHFHTVPVATEEATHEAWSLMAAYAAATSTIRLGQMCTCMSYRPPTYLAKVAATVDVISGGRLEMGIGAGWYEQEWRAYGYGFPRAGDRLGRLEEGVQIMRQMWAEGSASLNGRHYEVDGARAFPKPLQEGGVPLWIAGGGEQRTLRIAAKHAAYTNFSTEPEEWRRKVQVLREHCREIGRDPSKITLSGNYNAVVAETEREVEDTLARIRDRYVGRVPDAKVDEAMRNYENSPLRGTPEQVVQRLKEAESDGLQYAITYWSETAYDTSGIELFEREVIPALASGA